MNKITQEAINKCYTFMKEVRTRIEAGASFSYCNIAQQVKCTPEYFKHAKNLGYIIDGASGKLRFDEPVTKEMATEVLKSYNNRKKSEYVEKAEKPVIAAGYANLLSDQELINELMKRGYTGKVVKSTSYEF